MTWRQTDYAGTLTSWKRQCFILNGIDSYSGYGFANASAESIIRGVTECRFHHRSILYGITSNQGTHFTAREVWQWTHDH